MNYDPLLYHIVLTLHNSRTSQRMKQIGVIAGNSEYLSIEEEIELAKIMKGVIESLNLKCYAFNICRDHVHLIIACQQTQVKKIIGKLKGKSAFLFNRLRHKKGAFWSQKFYVANLDNWSVGSGALNAFDIQSSYFENAVAYIRNNRVKHSLPESSELNEIIESFVIDEE